MALRGPTAAAGARGKGITINSKKFLYNVAEKKAREKIKITIVIKITIIIKTHKEKRRHLKEPPPVHVSAEYGQPRIFL